MLQVLKITHTLVWVIMASSNFLAFYFAYIGRFDAWFWVPASLVFLETVIIIVNRWKCPLTDVAEKLTVERKSNFDIYLPEWLAKYNKEIFTVLIVLEIVVVLLHKHI